MCTQQNTQSVCLAQVNGKVKRMWVKALFKSEPKVNPNFALDMPTYKKMTDIHSFYPTVIHATYHHSDLVHVQKVIHNSNYILMEE